MSEKHEPESGAAVAGAAPCSAMLHVDDWIRDMGFDDKLEHGDAMYARWLMMHWRLPAYMKHNFSKYIEGRKLFCTYELLRYRCIGGSRMGDVWLTTNFDATHGYELRVDVAKCSAWSESPNGALTRSGENQRP